MVNILSAKMDPKRGWKIIGVPSFGHHHDDVKERSLLLFKPLLSRIDEL